MLQAMPPLQRLDEAMGVGRRGFRPQARAPAEPAKPMDLLLPNEGSAATLCSSAVSSTPARSQRSEVGRESRGKVLRTYKWSQFHGKEEVTEFDEAHFAAEGIFQQNSSEGHKEYQDRLRAIHLRKEGMGKAEIAKALGRSEKFVQKWWQKEHKEVPRPWGVHEYLTKDMGRNSKGVGATNGASMTEESTQDTATWWRDVEVRRSYASDPAIYDEILQNTEWKATNARTRDFATGAYHIKYDQRGNIRWEGHQNGKYKQGLSPSMDKVLQKLFAEYGIADRTSGVITNWYPDGKGNLGSHRHDCWTALFSFGHERILTIDNTPLLMQDGDLCIFGTQRHGVPIMPEVDEGRITLVIFFYPDKMQKQGMWQTITDPETMEASRPLQGMLRENKLGVATERQAAEHDKDILALQQLGFGREDVEMALRTCRFDVDQAAELLFLSGARSGGAADVALCDVLTPADEGQSSSSAERPAAAAGCGGRFRKARAEAAAEPALEQPCGSSSSSSSGASSSSTAVPSSGAGPLCASGASSLAEDSDEALARRLQMEEEGGGAAFPGAPARGMSEDEAAALALQMEEMEAERQADPSLLAAQFQEYDAMLTMEDAERWNGHGDLMHSPFSREHLSIEKMEKATIYSVGHGDMLEKDFWEMLQCHSIRVLYDIRQTDHRGELHSRHQRFSVASLRAQCRARGVIFKPMPLGRQSAYGTLAHIKTDEGQHTLVELVWQAKRKRTAFLGAEELWHNDARQVPAEVLSQAGHTVEHVRSDGSTERHESGIEYPDWLVREEDRLKMLEKKRQAGELGKPQKSRVDRSSEAVASRLATPAEEVDAMEEMRGAANQKELVVAQKKLARFQRIAEEKGLLAAKVVKNTPEWILEDARKQAEWVAAKKQEKAQAKVAEEAPSEVEGHVVQEVAEPSEERPCEAEACAEPPQLPVPGAEEAATAEPAERTSAEAAQTQEEPKRSTWRSRRRAAGASAGDT